MHNKRAVSDLQLQFCKFSTSISRKLAVFKILIVALSLSGCASNRLAAPVEDVNSPPSHKILTHRVAKGDTLYSIAWRYDTTVQDLVKINKLFDKSRIYVGQTLYLSKAAVPMDFYASEEANQRDKKRVTTTNTTVVITPSLKQEKNQNKRSKKTTLIRKPQKDPVNTASSLTWVWPHSGAIARDSSLSTKLNQGVDILGNLGDSVVAASSGIVVYSGEGLRGFGKLLIIKHNQNFLSAYAHNQKLLVKEGDKVSIKQPIARMGSTGTNRVKLHFEIRRDGKPVDPLGYLPRR